ncbi:unnamed protein product [Symbiodinium natans]|uniref:Apple domain-containing protein n=1 Tax=Symbiodinium natans TaxID=878477 RepID=A0A812UEQ7_9DINO|nr:unnamed protein product [Symbiodinium natans]
MALPSSDTEELLEAPQGSHSTLGTPFSRRVAMVLGGISLVALALMSQRSPRGLRSKMSGFVGLADNCLEMGMFYADPHKMENTERTVETTAESCQQRCVNTPACEHFTFWPDGGCLLTDASSTAKAAPYQYSDTVSGPAFCGGRPAVDGVMPAAEASVGTDVSTDSMTSEPTPVLPGINGTSCSAYPACMAVGINQGSCCPNDDNVLLGCCNGFPPPLTKALPIMPGAECTLFPGCANVTGSCCPAADGTRLACCDAPLI